MMYYVYEIREECQLLTQCGGAHRQSVLISLISGYGRIWPDMAGYGPLKPQNARWVETRD
jgi:hypothetical protein